MKSFVISFLFLFLFVGCSIISSKIGLGPRETTPEQDYRNSFGKVEDYPEIKELEKLKQTNKCHKLGEYTYESSWKYENMKLIFYDYVRKNKGNAFVRIDNNEKSGIMSEFTNYKIRYFKCS